MDMDMTTLRPAKDALLVAQSVSETGQQISKVAYSINSAASTGETSVTIVTHLSAEAIKTIKEKGYKLTAVNDQDERFCTVWNIDFSEDAQKGATEEEE